MSIHITIEKHDQLNLDHFKNIAVEFCGETEFTKDGLEIMFEKNYDAQLYRRVIEPYFKSLQPNSGKSGV